MVTKHLSTKQRKAWNWSEDFNRAGDIKLDRVPVDPAPVTTIFDVARIALYKGYYVLAG